MYACRRLATCTDTCFSLPARCNRARPEIHHPNNTSRRTPNPPIPETAFFGPNPRLPAEVLLNIVDALSIQDRLPLRILNRSWHAFFAGSLDSRVFAEVTLNYTARSFRALEDLAHAPVFRNYVTTITHRPSFLNPCPFIDDFWESYHT